MTLDKQAVERVARAICEASAFGDMIRKYPDMADHAWTQWEPEARAAIAALVPQEEEVGRMVERVRRGLDLAEVLSHDVPITQAAHERLVEAYDALERLVGIQGK